MQFRCNISLKEKLQGLLGTELVQTKEMQLYVELVKRNPDEM